MTAFIQPLLAFLAGGMLVVVAHRIIRHYVKHLRMALEVIESQQRAVYLLAHRLSRTGVVDLTREELLSVEDRTIDVEMFRVDTDTLRIIAK